MAQDIFSNIAREFITGNSSEIVDIVTFVEAPWGLNITLLPVQKFILRCLYGLPLEKYDKTIQIPDVINERILYEFSEVEFLRWLHAEGRCNTEVTEGKVFHELVLAIGRRGTKCRSRDDLIATTIGSMTFGELHDRLKNNENIGLGTYNQNTFKHSVSYGIKAEENKNVECFEIETKRGIREVSSWNHPYWVWRDEWEKPRFVFMRDIVAGDKIATASCTKLFGEGGIGVGKAALLGHLQGDGATTCMVGYSTASDVMLSDLESLVASEFPKYVVRKKGKSSWRYGYGIAKASGKYKQDGSRQNNIVEWLKKIGCFGKKAVDKEVPDCILKGNRKEVSAFLSRLFGCDGYASTEHVVTKGHSVPKSHIGYCSSSRKMIDGVRHLLLKYGIHGVVSKEKAVYDGKVFDTWKLRIVRKDSLRKFRDEIGIFSKEDAVDMAVDTALRRSDKTGEFDSIPRGVWNYVRRIMFKRGLSGADVVGKHGIGFNDRLRYKYAPCKNKVASYGTNIHDEFLIDIGSSDILWDTVRSVEPVGKRDTIDIEVPSTHVIGGDIVSHNSTMSACISNYELYRLLKHPDPSRHYGFPASTPICILNVAPTDDQAGIVFEMIQNMAMKCPVIKDRSLHNTMTYFDLQTDSDMEIRGKPKACLVSMSGGCSSSALRGRNAIVVIMDEMAHFIDNSGRFSGSEVYKALTPSIADFSKDGKIISISSPYAKYGAFYDRYQQSFEEQNLTLMFKMYSSMVNPKIPTEILAAARRRDRVGFMCEYGGEFSDSITAWVDEEFEFKKCVTISVTPNRGIPDVEYYMGIDLGFKNDGTAVVIVHQDPDSNVIMLDYADVWFSGSSDVWEVQKSIYHSCRKYAHLELLSMSDIIMEVVSLLKNYPIKMGIFDQSNGYGLAELFRKQGLKQFEMRHFTDQLNSDVYQLTKTMYADKLVALYDHPVLVPEVLSLEREMKSREKILVHAPNRKGAHDDISDAWVRAVWVCYQNRKKKPKNISTGAGGGVGSAGNVSHRNGPRVQSGLEHHLRKIQMHGAHPRGLDGIRRQQNRLSGISGSRMISM
jgi:hypothetical protein